ncbi:hypothetical protein H6G33_22120 [Calothrix sp. FACHB-1219]|uniref:hypothetical protein n=1 Tax=unclassified Calothrix TaxID=2619626 RepID=UPI0016895E39|nr:hypothetical protein [Calothrix sp. FACHB-168]MBD2206728.1 hypothetical protein [Calothrix sp. FACHB-168]MBD2219718.1 hypothetical protein [Calothrix sp. FACHB-1219]
MIKQNLIGILLLKNGQYFFSGLGRIIVTSLLLTTGLSTHAAAAEDKLIVDHLISNFSSENQPQANSANYETMAEQKINFSQVTVEQNNPNWEFTPVPTLEASSTTSDIPAKLNADFKQKLPQLIAQTDSSGAIGDTLGEVNRLRQELLIEPILEIPRPRAASPGSSAGTPSAFGASWGQAFIGGGGFIPFDGKADGSLSVGFGLGDAVKSVGLEVDINIYSVGGQKELLGDFGESGGVGFKLHKFFADGTAVAVAWSNPITWGEGNRAKDTIYGVVTRAFYLQPNSPNKLPLTVSLGVGTGSFRSLGALRDRSADNPPNFFGSLGLRVIPEASLVASWTGSALNLGASFAPFQNIPVVINTIFTDVTDNSVSSTGFSLSAGYSFKF